MGVKKITAIALLVAVSILGGNIKILGSIALDSFPAFLGALILGPLAGAVIGALGHIVSALLAGFPLSVPIHFIIAGVMAGSMIVFSYTYRTLEPKGRGIASLASAIVGYMVSVIFNTMCVYPFLGEVVFALLPPLTFAAIVNMALCYLVYDRVQIYFPRSLNSSIIKYRDLSYQKISRDTYLVVACDTSSSIGEKEGDSFFCPTQVTSAYCTRVVIFELLAAGVKPTMLMNMVGNSWEPTGKEAFLGIQKELQKAGLEHIEINGSTEENMKTSMTSISIVMMGLQKGHPWNVTWHKGDLIFLYGIPRMGTDVMTYTDQHVTYQELRDIKDFKGVQDVLPVGSKGVLSEVRQMAEVHQLQVTIYQHFEESHAIYPYDKALLQGIAYEDILVCSGGPSTSILVGVSKERVEAFRKTFVKAIPVAIVE